MVSFLLYYIISLILTSMLVGISGFALFGEKLQKINHWKAIAIFMIVLAILDLWYLPMILGLDISIKIGDDQLVKMLSLSEGYISLNELLKPGWWDILELFFGAVIAYNGGFYFHKVKTVAT